jgi:outer membrane biogenesis lipoprotein LolB
MRAFSFSSTDLRFAFSLSLVVMLGACASLNPPSKVSETSEQRDGRFSITAYQKDQQTVLDRQSGSFSAEISPSSARVDLVSPLGQIVARVSVAPNFASIETAQGQKFNDTSENADQRVTEKALGLPLPLLGLSKNLINTQSISVPGWNTELLETSNQRPKRIRMTWIRQYDESKHFDTLLNSEIGRIVVLVIINE